MTTRVLVVAFLLLLSTAMWAPDLRRLAGHPLGNTGISVNYGGVAVAVDPRAVSSRVRAADRVDLSRATFDERTVLWSHTTADAGTPWSLPMLRGSTPYVARGVSFREGSEVSVIWLRDAVQVVVMLLGALMVLRRPSPATWGFFLAIFIGCGTVNDVLLMGPDFWRIAGAMLFWVIANNGVGSYGLIVFAVYLLHERALPRWRRVVNALAVTFAVLTFSLSVWQAVTLYFASHPNPALWIAYSIALALPLFVAPVVLVATYFESPPNLRERLRWIIGGFILSALCNAFDQMGSSGNLGIIQMSYVTHSLLISGMYAFMAVPVAYAVLKHHIIDVSVALSRATVYTALSVIIVGLFALVDLFFTHALDQKNAGLIADVGLALLLGFSFNTMHRRVDAFVDRFLFRQRHRAEEHLRAVCEAMNFAQSEAHVRAMLTKDPIRAFDLTGAQIVSSAGGASEEVQTLASYMEARRSAVRISDGQWDLRAAVGPEFAPALVAPVSSHGRVDSMVVYGLHVNGTDLDAAEVALLQRVASSAGAALDRLEAEALRREVEALRNALRV
jgi:hypothetical protein